MDEGSNEIEPLRRPPSEGITLQGRAAPCGTGLTHRKGHVGVHQRPFPGAARIVLRWQPLPIAEVTIVGHVKGRSTFIHRQRSPMGMVVMTSLTVRMTQVVFRYVKPL